MCTAQLVRSCVTCRGRGGHCGQPCRECARVQKGVCRLAASDSLQVASLGRAGLVLGPATPSFHNIRHHVASSGPGPGWYSCLIHVILQHNSTQHSSTQCRIFTDNRLSPYQHQYLVSNIMIWQINIRYYALLTVWKKMLMICFVDRLYLQM